jgi:hypothetical protein
MSETLKFVKPIDIKEITKSTFNLFYKRLLRALVHSKKARSTDGELFCQT